jgi:hypothetical protein
MIEVRCCCQPQKLLGWLLIRQPIRVSTIRFPLMSGHRYLDKKTGYSCPVFDALDLDVARIVTPRDPVGYLVLKADGVPIETLRRLRGFEEYR